MTFRRASLAFSFSALSRIAFLTLMALALTAAHGVLGQAQQSGTTAPETAAPKTITITMLDGKTGKPLIPDNYIVRFNHLNAMHGESLKMNDDGTGTVTVPDNATFISVQGTYLGSMEIYVNCDAGMEKNTSTLHWYSIAEIESTGVTAANECYKGKYANTAISAKPGEFTFFVREANWREKAVE
jgi:DNA/RNA endonuclease YhcR with UshA esterase domain